jgi:hypothetical protein
MTSQRLPAGSNSRHKGNVALNLMSILVGSISITQIEVATLSSKGGW